MYQPTPPLNFVILAGWSELPPFALNSASQFRSPAPSSVKSFKYTIDYKEVKTVGSASSTTRTAEQTETALFWDDVAAKEWNFAVQKGLADLSADEWRAARTLAVLNISLADGVIATFDTKFQFNYWRPSTAIHAGDNDGNWATKGDPNWEPRCVTPLPRIPLDARGHGRRGGRRARPRARRSAHVHRHQPDRREPDVQAVQRGCARRGHLAHLLRHPLPHRGEHGVRAGRADCALRRQKPAATARRLTPAEVPEDSD